MVKEQLSQEQPGKMFSISLIAEAILSQGGLAISCEEHSGSAQSVCREFCRRHIVVMQILKQLQLSPGSARLTDDFLQRTSDLANLVPAQHKIGEARVLFKEISPETEEYLRDRYSTILQTIRSLSPSFLLDLSKSQILFKQSGLSHQRTGITAANVTAPYLQVSRQARARHLEREEPPWEDRQRQGRSPCG